MNRRKIRIMAIVNLTADSFFSSSRQLREDGKLDRERLRTHLLQALDAGADILDIGAVSTRPGSVPVDEEEEWRRIDGALDVLKEVFPGALPPLSFDTFRSGVVRRIYDRIGPFTVNDISSGEDDPAMLGLVAALGLPYIAMHKRGTPSTMPSLTDYPDGVVAELLRYFTAFAERAERLGIREWILDPGFGFAKTVEQNYDLLSALSEFQRFGRDVLVGVSRKTMIWKPLGITPEQALLPTQLLHLKALEAGAAILRVHDVREAVQTLQIFRLLHCK